jgi:opacity protein-like surface antigen
MRRTFVLMLIVLMFAGISAFAQERKPEIFVGYSNLQAEGLPDKNNVTGIFSSDFLNNRTTLHGFTTDVSGFFLDNLGITGNFSFNENSRSHDTATRSDAIKTDVFYFLGGPTLKVGHSARLQPFVRFLAGAAYTRFDVQSEQAFPSGTITNSFKTHTTDFALGAGGGVDWRASDRLKVRLVQIDYVPVFLRDQSVTRLTQAGAIEPFTLNGQRMDNVRFSFGIVF